MGFGTSLLLFVVGMTLGVVAGYAFGRLAVWTINRINIENQSLYAVLLLAFVFLTFSVTDLIRGNGYLAVYVAGLVVGNYPIVHKKTLGTFFDGFTWLFQVILFVTLGLLVNIDELLQPEVLLLGGLTGLFMILVARPAAVFLSLLPFRKFTTRARLYVSWVGLRGAVPIIFATYPVVAGVEDSSLLFNIVFFVTLLSLVVQGTTVSLMAEWLGLAYPERERIFNDEVMNRMLDDATTELTVTEAMLEPGHHLRDIVLPAATLVVMVARRRDVFRPQGQFGAPRGRQAAGGDREQVGGEVGRPAAGVKRRGRRTENPPPSAFLRKGRIPVWTCPPVRRRSERHGPRRVGRLPHGGGFPAGRRDACSPGGSRGAFGGRLCVACR